MIFTLNEKLKHKTACFLWLHHSIKLKYSRPFENQCIHFSWPKFSLTYLVYLETLGSPLELKIRFSRFDQCVAAMTQSLEVSAI